MLFVNGYRDNAPNPIENPNSTNEIYSGDVFGYWGGIDAQFINRINTRNVIYADGHHTIGTSNHHQYLTNKTNDLLLFLECKIISDNIRGCMENINSTEICEMTHAKLTLHTEPNQIGFTSRKTAGEIAGHKIITKINNQEIAFDYKTDTLDIVCHSMGYAYTVGMIEKLKSEGFKNFGRIYIIAPENAISGGTDWSLFKEVWQYGSNLGEPNQDPLYLQDGVAPQIKVFGIDQLKSKTKGGRVFIPSGVKKGFLESHSISNYGWIFTERTIGKTGYVAPRK